MCVRACVSVCKCVRACMRAHVRACVRACVYVCVDGVGGYVRVCLLMITIHLSHPISRRLEDIRYNTA